VDTSISLLDSLHAASHGEAWVTLVDLYSPIVRGWLRRHGVVENDADDLVQEVLTVVVRRLPEFRREPRAGAFRRWLRTITANCLRDHWRRQNKRAAAVGGTDFCDVINQLADPESGISRLWDAEHDAHVSQYLLQRIRPNFSDKTWAAFQRFAVDGLSADAVANELNITPNAVFIAKSRVLASLRQLGKGLID
jgi:RNA polymerase sigma-70 factor (ECF subfamily)